MRSGWANYYFDKRFQNQTVLDIKKGKIDIKLDNKIQLKIFQKVDYNFVTKISTVTTITKLVVDENC